MRILHQKRYVKIGFYLTAFILLSSSSCGRIGTDVKVKVEHLDEAIKTLDTGINTLGRESGSWRKTLEDVRDKTTADVQSTIKTEISNLIDHGVSVVGQESRCNVDFVAKRSRLELIRIKNALVAERNGLAQKVGIPPIPSSTVPPVTPAICIVSPGSLNLTIPQDRRNEIDFSGYDFDSESITVLLKNTDQEIDVTQHLAKPSPFNMSLNLGGQGVPVSSNSQKFLVRSGGKEISSINILQPSAQIPMQLAQTFGYIKNSRLVATGRSPEPMDGHVNWAIYTGQSLDTVKNEIRSDLTQARWLIAQSPSMKSCRAFGYMKDGMLTLVRETTEPYEGHVLWCQIELERSNWNQVVSAMDQEFVQPIQAKLRSMALK
jgi:hypothetical protein